MSRENIALYARLHIVREGDRDAEARFFAHFVEDRSRAQALSYYEFLLTLQKEVAAKAATLNVTVLGAPLSQQVILRVGQAIAAVPGEATAFSHRDARYIFHPISIWADSANDERMIAANRAFTAAIRPYTTGATYLNFTAEGDRVHDGYGDDKYARLVALKDAYDPANRFRLNQNIRPSQPAAEPTLA